MASTTFAISRISSFAGAIVRSLNITADSIHITTMRAGRTLVYIYYKKHKAIYWVRVQIIIITYGDLAVQQNLKPHLLE